MICKVMFAFLAYNYDLDKLERVKILRCETKHYDFVKTIPANRECGFNLLNGKKYWYCFINKEKEK